MNQPDTRTGAEPGPSAQAAQPEPHAQSPAAERNRGPQTLRSMLSFSERVDLLIRVVLAVAVSIGCYFIIEPFLTAIVIAAILAVVTWPLFASARSSAGGSTTLPALLMVFLLIIGVLIPSSFLLIALAQQIPKGISVIRESPAASRFRPPSPRFRASALGFTTSCSSRSTPRRSRPPCRSSSSRSRPRFSMQPST